MGIKSKSNWSGTIVNGVTLGEPAFDEVTLTYHWDGGVPEGVVDPDGDFLADGDDAVLVPFIEMENVKTKDPDGPELVQDTDINGDPILVEVPHLYSKEDMVVFEGVLYRCNKDGIVFDPSSKDWSVPKTKVVK